MSARSTRENTFTPAATHLRKWFDVAVELHGSADVSDGKVDVRLADGFVVRELVAVHHDQMQHCVCAQLLEGDGKLEELVPDRICRLLLDRGLALALVDGRSD